MAEAKQFDDWDRMSALLAKLHNCHARSHAQVEPADMHPMIKQGSRPGAQETTGSFNRAMCDALDQIER